MRCSGGRLPWREPGQHPKNPAGALEPGKTIVHALIIGEHARSLFSSDDDEVVRLVFEEMRRFFPGMPERPPLLARVYRWPEAFCLSPGGMLRDMQDMRVQLNRCLGGLFLAGDYTHLPSLNGAMRSGVGSVQPRRACPMSVRPRRCCGGGASSHRQTSWTHFGDVHLHQPPDARKSHVRWCGRGDECNPVTPTRSVGVERWSIAKHNGCTRD